MRLVNDRLTKHKISIFFRVMKNIRIRTKTAFLRGLVITLIIALLFQNIKLSKCSVCRELFCDAYTDGMHMKLMDEIPIWYRWRKIIEWGKRETWKLLMCSHHGILNLRQCMQHFEFWLRVRCLVERFFDVVQMKIIVSMIRRLRPSDHHLCKIF